MRTIKSLAALGLLLVTGTAVAVPVPYTAAIINGNWRQTVEYSVVREENRPWETIYQFDDDQSIDMILDVDAGGNLLGISAMNQQFTLDGGAELFNLIDLDITVDAGNGRPEGTMDYSIVSAANDPLYAGTFVFYDIIWFGPFNSTDLSRGSFSLYLWGDDHDAGIGIDFAVARVPEPGSLALLGLGILGLAGFTRRRRHSG